MTIAGMPNIPNFAGLVTSAEDAAISFGGAALIKAVFGSVWGVVNQYGVPVLLYDSFVSMNYDNTQETSKDPIENGKVMTYNKVNNPRRCSVVLAKGTGGALARGAFLAQVETYVNSTLMFHVITPETVITNQQMIGYSYARSNSDGLQLIKVAIDFEESKIATVDFSTEQVANVEDSAEVDSGKVQPTQNQSILSTLGDAVVNGISSALGN